MARAKINVGDVFVVPLDGPFAILQYVGKGHDGDLVRVLPPVQELPALEAVAGLVAERQLYVIQGFLSLLLRQNPQSKVMGNFPVPAEAEGIPPMIVSPRSTDHDRAWVKLPEGGRSIRISEFRARFPDVVVEDLVGTAVPFPATMLACIRLGWMPRFGDTGSWLGSQSTRPELAEEPETVQGQITTSYFGFVASREDADVVAEAVRSFAAAVEVREVEDAETIEWLVKFQMEGRPSEQAEKRFETVLLERGGVFDGTEVGPLT